MQDVHAGFVCCITLAECVGKTTIYNHVCKLFLLQLGLCFLGQTKLTLQDLPGDSSELLLLMQVASRFWWLL